MVGDREILDNIFTFYKTENLLEPEKYQISTYIKEGIVYIALELLFEKLNRQKTNYELLNSITKKLSNIITEDDIALLKKENKNRDFIVNKLKIFFFPWDIPIWLFGNRLTGKLTIINSLFGLTYKGIGYLEFIPYEKYFGEKSIVFKKYCGSDSFLGLRTIKHAPYSFLVIDSTDKNHFSKNDNYIKAINQIKLENKKILIIANKQDLPGAARPDEIEAITGFPTVGFSAIAPDAPEKLEKIISGFLKS